jgi:hypothetical protein
MTMAPISANCRGSYPLRRWPGEAQSTEGFLAADILTIAWVRKGTLRRQAAATAD